MAEVRRSIGVPPDQVFAVLADAYSYDRWVVGAKGIRSADPSWPQPGSRLHHTVGFGPLTLADDTKVIECDAPRRLVLEGRARPVGIAHIEFQVTGRDSGSLVTLTEWVARPALLTVLNPVFEPLVRARNKETLRRLAEVVTERFPDPQAVRDETGDVGKPTSE